MPAGSPPAGLPERARALARGELAVAPARDAATVALLRDGPDGLQVYLLRRVRAMSFAAGMHVFPGGAVDPADAELADGPGAAGWAGPPPSAFAAALGCDEPLARSLVRAAVRETFEESGVLLAGRTPDSVLGDVSTDEWEAERVALETGQQTLPGLLARRGLLLRADLLRPWAHWITPEVEPKRFDTRFFAARVPEGQRCREAGGEADRRLWIRPQEALDRGLRMMPPTAAVLSDLAAVPDVEAALATPRTITPVLPELVLGEDDRIVLRLPGEPS